MLSGTITKLGALAIGAATSLAALPAAAVVNCDLGGSVQQALDQGQRFVQFTGTCNEQVQISENGVFLLGASGDRTRDVLAQGAFVLGATEVNFSDLSIKGLNSSLGLQSNSSVSFFNVAISEVFSLSASGGSTATFDSVTISGLNGSIVITQGATADFFGVTISDLAGGLTISDGANVRMFDSSITDTDNGTFVVRSASLRLVRANLGPSRVDDGNLSANPLSIGDNSNARIDNSTISGTTNDPIVGGALVLFRDASVVLRGANSVTNVGTQPAVGIFADSSFRQDDAFGAGTATIDGGILIEGGSYFDLREAEVTGDVNVSLRSALRVGSTDFGGDSNLIRFNNSINLSEGAALAVRAPGVVVAGNLACADRTSSVGGDFQVLGRTIRCRDFNGRRIGRIED